MGVMASAGGYPKPRYEIPEDDADDTYPFGIHSTRHHPDSDEDMGCSGSTCVGRDEQRAEIVSYIIFTWSSNLKFNYISIIN